MDALPATTSPRHPPARMADDNDDNDDDEMPLLFMDGLPSNFKQNAQLAALVTFMGSDNEETKEEDEDTATATTGKQSAAQQRRKARCAIRRPYARHDDTKKPSAIEDMGEKEQKRTIKNKKRSATAAQELSLYLSMFTVSKE